MIVAAGVKIREINKYFSEKCVRSIRWLRNGLSGQRKKRLVVLDNSPSQKLKVKRVWENLEAKPSVSEREQLNRPFDGSECLKKWKEEAIVVRCVGEVSGVEESLSR